HLVGHSAGAYVLGHLLNSASHRDLSSAFASIHLMAPACTVQFANQHYTPHAELMRRLHLYLLSDRLERDDHVVRMYRKSLLYVVSNRVEADLPPPLLALRNTFQPDYSGWDGSSSTREALGNWRQAAELAGLDERLSIIDRPPILSARPDRRIPAAHGSFDNDVEVMTHVLEQVIGGPLPSPIENLQGF